MLCSQNTDPDFDHSRSHTCKPTHFWSLIKNVWKPDGHLLMTLNMCNSQRLCSLICRRRSIFCEIHIFDLWKTFEMMFDHFNKWSLDIKIVFKIGQNLSLCVHPKAFQRISFTEWKWPRNDMCKSHCCAVLCRRSILKVSWSKMVFDQKWPLNDLWSKICEHPKGTNQWQFTCVSRMAVHFNL